jgi:LysM repeat protein
MIAKGSGCLSRPLFLARLPGEQIRGGPASYGRPFFLDASGLIWYPRCDMLRPVFIALMVASLFLLNCSQALSLQDEGDRPAVGGSCPAGYGNGQGEDAQDALPDSPLFSRAPWIRTFENEGREDVGEDALYRKNELTEEESRILETIRKSLAASSVSDGFDIPIVLNDAVNLYIKYFTGTGRKVFARWLERAKRYVPTIRAILKKNGLPEDLVYLAMIESGFNMKAYSPAKARGPWQFIHETGARYGLKVDFWVDERCDLEKSTAAAGRYLKELFDRFGCWYLAAAGYNAGEHRVERAIERHDTKDFWKLREYKTLPKETQEYVPQLIAAALIAKDPEKYGFADTGHPPVYELMKVGVPGGVALGRIARTLSLDVGEIKALNPEIVRGITPPNRKEYQITVPGIDSPDAVSERLEAELESGGQVVGVVKYQVKKGNSLAGILKRYQVSRSDLMLVNEGGDHLAFARGQVLYIPRFAPGKRDAGVDARAAGNGNREKIAFSADDENDIVTLKSAKRHRISLDAKPALAKHAVHKADRRVPHKAGKGESRTAKVRKTRSRP